MTDCEACASTVNTDVEYKSHESTPTEKARSRNRADIPEEQREREGRREGESGECSRSTGIGGVAAVNAVTPARHGTGGGRTGGVDGGTR